MKFLITMVLITSFSCKIEAQPISPLKKEVQLALDMLNSNKDSARAIATPLLKEGKRMKDGYTIIMTSWVIAWVLEGESEYEQAVFYYLDAINSSEELEFERKQWLLSKLYMNCSKIFMWFNAYDLAESYQKKAIYYADEIQDTTLLFNGGYSLARTYREKGKHESSIRVLNSIEPLCQMRPDYYNKILNRKSVSYYYLHNYDSVISIAKLLTKILPESDHKLGGAYQNLGLSFMELGLHDSAEFYFNKSVEFKRGIGNKYNTSLVNTIVDFSNLYMKIDELEKAEKLLFEGEDILRKLPENDKNQEWHFELYGVLRRLYARLGDLEKSRFYEEKYDSELMEYTHLFQRYNMELIVQNYFDQIEEEERDASIKFYGGIASGGLMVLLTSIFIIGKIRASQTNRKLERNEAGKKLAELKALKAQINPHFLFNSLNSIQSFILEDEKNMADEYLVKYGKLIRKILDHSNELTVTLNDELEALQLYVELEQLRIKEGFDFEVIIQESIDPYNAMIPSMVIQPFIENAIWHGVSGFNGKGKIKLTISEHDDLIEVRVEDNGIGFDTDTDQNTSSKGVRLVRERLELLKETTGKESVFEMESEQGEGTTAILHFRNDLS
ncbi:MAG: histidine kinase [Cyclobacteriaceae bacterium]